MPSLLHRINRGQLWVILIILVGFAIRVYGIGDTGFWVDEARTGLAARLDLPQMLAFSRQTAYEHPPLYFAMLHAWLSLVEENEWNARFLSVLFGTLSLPLAYGLYRRFSTTLLASLATLFLALSPFHVAYSKDNRMYAWIGFLALLSVIVLLNYLASARARWLILYGFLALLGVFSHYMFAFLISACVVYAWVLAVQGRTKQHWKAAGYVTLIAALVGLGIAAWVLQSSGVQVTVASVTSSSGRAAPEALRFTVEKARKIANDFLIAEKDWSLVPTAVQLMIVGAWILALGGGLAEATRPKLVRREGAILFLLIIFVPLIELLLIPRGVVGRYILFAFPAFSFLVVVAIARVWQALPLAGLALAGMIAITVGFGHYTTLTAPKDDVYLAARFLGQVARPNDQVLLTHLFDRPLTEYYAERSDMLRIVHYPADMTPATREEIERDVPHLIENGGRLWLGPVTPGSLDTEGIVERWLAQRAFQVQKRWFPAGTYLSFFLLSGDGAGEFDAKAESLAGALQLPRRFGDLLLLKEVLLDTTGALAGSGIRLLLEWDILNETDNDVLVSLELRDADGAVWSQRLSPMQGGTLSSRQWTAGETVVDRHGLWIPEGMPPGAYRLELRVYDATQGYALPIGEDDGLALATITVEPGSMPLPAVPLARDLAPGLRLLGADQWPDFVEQGTRLPVTLYWLPQSSGLPEQTVRLELVDRAGKIVSSGEAPLGPGWYPASLWQTGVPIKDTNTLDIPGRLQPGTYRLRAALLPTLDGIGAANSPPVELGKIQVTAKPRDFRAPEVRHSTDQTVGDFARLVGYDIQPESALSPGQAIRLSLVWQAVGETDQDYTVFVHLVGPDGQLVGQKDNPPRRGTHPTSSWLRGEYIADEYVVPVPNTLAPGAYSVYVGMYDPNSGQRLPATDANGARWPADAALLHQLQGE